MNATPTPAPNATLYYRSETVVETSKSFDDFADRLNAAAAGLRKFRESPTFRSVANSTTRYRMSRAERDKQKRRRAIAKASRKRNRK